MPTPLKLETVADRLQSTARDEYLYAGSIMQGIALAGATYSLFLIVGDLQQHWLLLSPWCVSFLALLVSHLTWTRGVLLTNSNRNVLDSVFPMLMGIAEVMLFAVLTPSKEQPKLPLFWLFALFGHTALAAGLVINRIVVIDPKKDFEDRLQGLAQELKKWIHCDAIGASIIAALAFSGWLSIQFIARTNVERAFRFQALLAILPFGALLLKVIYDTGKQSATIDSYISKRLSKS